MNTEAITRRTTRHLVLGVLASLLYLLFGAAWGQQFGGTFTTMGSAGPVNLTLQQNGQALSGTLEGNGNSFGLQGEVLAEDPTVAFGTIEGVGGTLIFEAYLDGTYLEFYLFTPLPEGSVDMENVTLFEFELATAASPPAAGGDGGGAGNPLTGAPTANPLAAPAQDRFTGTFTDGAVTLELRSDGTGYAGTLTVGGSTFPVEAQSTGNGLQGTFTAGTTPYPFTLSPSGQALLLESEGATYTLSPAGNPLGGAAGENGRTAGPGAQPAGQDSPGQVLANGPYGQFTVDAALAFIEALHFSLQQVGQGHILANTSQQQIVDALAASYPGLDPDSQMALASARQIWTETQSGWAMATPTQKQEFVYAVLAIAYGDQAARNALGMGQGGGQGGGGGGPIGMPSPDPQIQEDTVNAQNCWAAAGCEGYDPVGDDFTFETPGDY